MTWKTVGPDTVRLVERFDKVASRFRAPMWLLLSVALVALPGAVWAQIPPGEAWRTLDTEHFRITFPEELHPLAQRAAERAERAWDALAAEFIEAPGHTVDILITDHTDVSNGYASVFPSSRIVIHAPPPVDGFGLPFADEWMELVVTHELAHIFHEDYTRNLGSALRSVLGRVPLEWPFFPGAATPGWVVEGIATYYESEFTDAGRVRGSFHEMVIRTAILEGAFESIDQTSGNAPIWPGGQRDYVYGSLFLKHLADRFGQHTVGEFARVVAGQWIPYRLNDAARETFGISFSDAWEEWKTGLEMHYDALRDSLNAHAPITRGEALTDDGYYAWSPEPAPAGGFAFARVDGRSDPQLRFQDPDTRDERKLTRTNSLSQFSWTPDGGIVFSQTEYTDSYRIRGDLFVRRPDGKVARITRGQRIDHPDVAPEGRRAVAVQEGLGSNRLVMVDLESGGITPLVDFQDHVLWSYPRWSPDGRRIAVARWTAGAYLDIVILSPSGEVVREVTRDRAMDIAPAWSPDGQWLLWASDRSGIPNVYATSAGPGTEGLGVVRQVTNLLGGGAYPAVDASGEWIYFSAYHADGWRIERIPYDPSSWFQPFPVQNTALAVVDTDRLERSIPAPARPYNPVHTLGPTFWAPTYREGDHAGSRQVLKPGFGIFTSGEDLVGRHAYSFSGTYSGGPGAFNGRAAYTYGGLENPLISVEAVQIYDAGSQALRGVTEAGDTVPLYLLERERALGIGAGFFRQRARSQVALNLSASHIWEDRFLLEEDLEETTRFRLTHPDTRFVEGRAILSLGTARQFFRSVSPEDGVAVTVRGRVRRDLSRADSLRDVEGHDRSFQDLVGSFTAYKSLRWPGFGNHVLGARFSAGVASGPGADQFHFELGGASGGVMPFQFLELGSSLLFPLRGYPTARRFGRYAWSTSLEYRFPIGLLNWGPGLFPLHLNWLAGALFFDAGNAWGPELSLPYFNNPRADALASAGGELILRTLPLWFQSVDLRFGVAQPLVDGDGPRTYLRLGVSF
jgi:hypothetical protein